MTAIDTNLLERGSSEKISEGEELVIRPVRGWIGVDWAEIARFRELLFFLVWRDLKVRYKQTVLGVAWAVLQPLFNMLAIVWLSHVGGIEWPGPAVLYVYAGLMPWTFFSTGVNLGGLSLVNQAHLLTKVYFPRVFVPSSSILAGLVDMVISLAMFAVLMVCFRRVPSWEIIFLPGLIALTLMATLGFGYLLSALTVSYRDFRYVIPFMIQGMMLVSVVIFPMDKVPENHRWILAINPIAGIIDGYRSAIFGDPWKVAPLCVSAGVTVALFLFGLFYFRKTERRFADIA